jgi:hypothetical protein
MRATDLLIWGFIAHVVADWFLQNEWMSDNKTSLRHPAAYAHSGIHLAAMMFVFPVWAAVALAVSHLLIDTRVPLQMWRRFYRQTTQGPVMLPFGMWQDQMLHLLCIAAFAIVCV